MAPEPEGRFARFERRVLLDLATAFLLLALGLMLLEARSRFFVGRSFFWSEEAVRFLVAWSFFLSLGAAGRAGRYIRTPLLVDRLPEGRRWLPGLFAAGAGLLFAAVLFWGAVNQWLAYLRLGTMSQSNLDLPLWLVYAAVPLGAVLLGLYYLGRVRVALQRRDPFAGEGMEH